MDRTGSLQIWDGDTAKSIELRSREGGIGVVGSPGSGSAVSLDELQDSLVASLDLRGLRGDILNGQSFLN